MTGGSAVLFAVFALVLVGVVWGQQSLVKVQNLKFSFQDHSDQELKLVATGQAPGEKVVFRIVRNLYSVPGSPNSNDGFGKLDAPAGWNLEEVLPFTYSRVSSEIFAQPGGSYGAAALKKIDIYPQYGDLPGAWLVQSGNNNYVKMQFKRVKAVTSIKIYETLNPGGVFRLKAHSRSGETAVVYEEGGNNFARETLPNGASILTITFEELTFDLKFLTVYVDASTAWRGIDAIVAVGLTSQKAEVPGDLWGDRITINPLPEKPYGCDAFTYQAHDGKGGPVSNTATVTVCYGCPLNPTSGQICSGVGVCDMAECTCQVGFKGDACEDSVCPRIGGKICNGKGNCVNGQCDCFRDWTGETCDRKRTVRRCAACNDPHYTSFDNAVFSYYETGETLLFQWRKRPGPPLMVAQHLWNCGSNAYMEPWSPIGCVDGISVRLGDNIVNWMCAGRQGKPAGSYVNCNAVNPQPGVWQNIGSDGLQVNFMGSNGMEVRVKDTFYASVNCGCFQLLDSLPDAEPYSNEIVGMCGNNDGIRSNDLWGAQSWIQVPRFPTDDMSPIAGTPEAQNNLKRARAIAWGEFFKPSNKCDLLNCNKCGSYLNYNQFPISYAGNTNLARAEHIAAAKVLADIKARAPTEGPSNKATLTLLTTLTKAKTEDREDIKGGRVGVDGDIIPDTVRPDDLPDHLIGCPYEILYRVMNMNSCMQWIGGTGFDDCVWDACALASKAGGLSIDEALTKALEINKEKMRQREVARLKMIAMENSENTKEIKQEAASKPKVLLL